MYHRAIENNDAILLLSGLATKYMCGPYTQLIAPETKPFQFGALALLYPIRLLPSVDLVDRELSYNPKILQTIEVHHDSIALALNGAMMLFSLHHRQYLQGKVLRALQHVPMKGNNWLDTATSAVHSMCNSVDLVTDNLDRILRAFIADFVNKIVSGKHGVFISTQDSIAMDKNAPHLFASYATVFAYKDAESTSEEGLAGSFAAQKTLQVSAEQVWKKKLLPTSYKILAACKVWMHLAQNYINPLIRRYAGAQTIAVAASLVCASIGCTWLTQELADEGFRSGAIPRRAIDSVYEKTTVFELEQECASVQNIDECEKFLFKLEEKTLLIKSSGRVELAEFTHQKCSVAAVLKAYA